MQSNNVIEFWSISLIRSWGFVNVIDFGWRIVLLTAALGIRLISNSLHIYASSSFIPLEEDEIRSLQCNHIPLPVPGVSLMRYSLTIPVIAANHIYGASLFPTRFLSTTSPKNTQNQTLHPNTASSFRIFLQSAAQFPLCAWSSRFLVSRCAVSCHGNFIRRNNVECARLAFRDPILISRVP